MAGGDRDRPLTEEAYKRVDAALGTVVEQAGGFTDFQVDFAMGNADRLDRFGRATRFTEKQWKVIAEIEQRIAALNAGG
jgi:hypothetical protein